MVLVLAAVKGEVFVVPRQLCLPLLVHEQHREE
jgi:hypothetical protein